MRNAHLTSTKALITIIGAAAFYAAFIFYSDVSEFAYEWNMLNPLYIPLVLLVHFIAIAIRAFRQKVFLDSLNITIPLKQNLGIHIAGLSMLITPVGSGELVKTLFMKKKLDSPLMKTIPMVLAERYHDLLAVISILAISSFFGKLEESRVVVIVVSLLLATVYVALRSNKIFAFFIERVPRRWFLKDLYENRNEFYRTFYTLSQPRTTLSAWMIGLVSWSFDAVAIYLGFLAFGLDYSFIDSTLIMYTATIIGAVSFLPAGLGITESGMLGLLVKTGLTLSLASALVLFTRLTSVWFSTIIGLIAAKFFISSSK